MKIMRVHRLAAVFAATSALATPPPYTTLNVMFQFTCISLSPPMYSGGTIGDLNPAPVIQTERSIGGRQARHRILLEEGRYVQIDERLVTSQECSRAPRDAISWAPSGREGLQADFCITASGAVGSNVMVRLTIPRLETDYERRVVEAFHLISSCKIERGPFEFFSSDRFVIGRQLWIPRIER